MREHRVVPIQELGNPIQLIAWNRKFDGWLIFVFARWFSTCHNDSPQGVGKTRWEKPSPSSDSAFRDPDRKLRQPIRIMTLWKPGQSSPGGETARIGACGLVDILTDHVVPGKLRAKDVIKLRGDVAVNGQRVDIQFGEDGVKRDRAKVLTTDILCDKGVIHVIGRVILTSLTRSEARRRLEEAVAQDAPPPAAAPKGLETDRYLSIY